MRWLPEGGPGQDVQGTVPWPSAWTRAPHASVGLHLEKGRALGTTVHGLEPSGLFRVQPYRGRSGQCQLWQHLAKF